MSRPSALRRIGLLTALAMTQLLIVGASVSSTALAHASPSSATRAALTRSSALGSRLTGASYTIKITGPSSYPGFSPSTLAVHVGDQVTFVNGDTSQSASTYTVVADDGSFTSNPITPGGSWTYQATSDGAVNYHELSNPTTCFGLLMIFPADVSFLSTPSASQEQQILTSLTAGGQPQPVAHKPASAPASHRTLPIGLLVGFIVALAVIGFFAALFVRGRSKRKLAS